MMVKVLLDAYTNGIMSSCRIAAMPELDITFPYLAAKLQPDYCTINGFERLTWTGGAAGAVHGGAGVVRGGGSGEAGTVVALDGHRVAGNASLSQNRKREQLGAEIQMLLEEAAQVDTQECEFLKLCRSSGGTSFLPGWRIRGSGPNGCSNQVASPEDARANRTDPESRVLKTRRGWVQGYNAQAMVDCDSQVIVAQQVTNEENDLHQVAPMLEQCEEQAGARPKQLLADAGYWSEANGALDGVGGTELLIATVHWAREKQENHPRRDLMEAELETEAHGEGPAAHSPQGLHFHQSGRPDLNRRPPEPHSGAATRRVRQI
jgi:hypothetical protein